MSETMVISIPDTAGYELKKRAAEERMDPDEYARLVLLDDLGIHSPDDIPFGDYVVSRLNVSGEKRRRNVKRVSEAVYDIKKEYDEPGRAFFTGDGPTETIPRELWEQAVTDATTDLVERDNKDFDTYRPTVLSNCSTDLGFDGVADFRRELAKLIKQYDL
jgi:hypothetical protein